MARDPHAADAHAVVIAGMGDIYLHVDSLHTRCISFLDGGSCDEFPVLLSCADDVLRSLWWLACDSLATLREAGAISAGGSQYPKVSPDIPDGREDYEDDPRRAIASLVGAIGEVEQQLYHLMHAADRDVRKTADALLLIGYLSSIALERIEAIGSGDPAAVSP